MMFYEKLLSIQSKQACCLVGMIKRIGEAVGDEAAEMCEVEVEDGISDQVLGEWSQPQLAALVLSVPCRKS
jgi:hypothetical protein